MLNQGGETVAVEGGAVRLDNQPAHSVKVIKFIDSAIPAAAPATLRAQVPGEANPRGVADQALGPGPTGRCAGLGLPLGLGLSECRDEDGPQISHAYTWNADFTVRLTVDGLDGVPAQQSFPVKVTGNGIPLPEIRKNQRYSEPFDR